MWNLFFVIDGELYYVRHKGTTHSVRAKVVCGTKEANRIFEEFHASSLGAHTGKKKTVNAISTRFFWPGMSNDIETWVCTNLLIFPFN